MTHEDKYENYSILVAAEIQPFKLTGLCFIPELWDLFFTLEYVETGIMLDILLVVYLTF
jgi:hypothetical protein